MNPVPLGITATVGLDRLCVLRPAKRIFEPNPNRIVSSAKGGTRKKFVVQGYTELVTDLLKSFSSKDSGLNLKFGSVPDLRKHQR